MLSVPYILYFDFLLFTLVFSEHMMHVAKKNVLSFIVKDNTVTQTHPWEVLLVV